MKKRPPGVFSYCGKVLLTIIKDIIEYNKFINFDGEVRSQALSYRRTRL